MLRHGKHVEWSSVKFGKLILVSNWKSRINMIVLAHCWNSIRYNGHVNQANWSGHIIIVSMLNILINHRLNNSVTMMGSGAGWPVKNSRIERVVYTLVFHLILSTDTENKKHTDFQSVQHLHWFNRAATHALAN